MSENNLKTDYIYFEGAIVPAENAKVRIKTHALQYGTGCFGGIRGYWNQKQEQLYLFRLKDHFLRLKKSAKILMMKPKHSIEELIELTLQLIKKNEWHEDIYIRPFLYKNALTLSPRLHDVTDDIAIYTQPLGDYLPVDTGLRCKVSSWMRIPDNVIPTRAKASGGYINSALAKSEALLEGYDEAIFLDHSGNVSEGSAENLFIVREGKLITPPVTDSILEGITRRSLIEMVKKEFDFDVEERSIARTELYIADEVFFCGTGVQVAWIKEIDRRIIGNGSIGLVTHLIRDKYFNVVTGKFPAYKNWLTAVY